MYEDYDCMLNQTNIGYNNNKFYVVQVIKASNIFYSWNRWGRVVSLFDMKKSLLTVIFKKIIFTNVISSITGDDC